MSLKSSAKLRLWHLSVAVAVLALIFGAIRYLDSNRMMLGLLLALVGVLIWMVPCVTLIHLGAKLAGKTSREWSEWGARRGGLAGLCLSLFGHSIQGVIFLVGLMLGGSYLILSGVILAYLYGFIEFGPGFMVSVRTSW